MAHPGSQRLESHTDYVSELKEVIIEKNRIIDDLRFIITQKDSIITSLRTSNPIETGNPRILEIPRSTHHSPQPSSPRNPLPNPKEELDRHNKQNDPNDKKDILLKELFHILTTQLDWRKVDSSLPAVRNVLKPIVGKYRFDDGQYEGEMLAGQPNGKGKTVLDNGDSYEGEYLHGKKTGLGVYRWKNGDTYEGDHLDGHEHGKGVYEYADGDIYSGDYVGGKRNGFGILKLKSGTTEYGFFKDGHYHGRCIMVSYDEKMVSFGDLNSDRQDGTWRFYNLSEVQEFSKGKRLV